MIGLCALSLGACDHGPLSALGGGGASGAGIAGHGAGGALGAGGGAGGRAGAAGGSGGGAGSGTGVAGQGVGGAQAAGGVAGGGAGAAGGGGGTAGEGAAGHAAGGGLGAGGSAGGAGGSSSPAVDAGIDAPLKPRSCSPNVTISAFGFYGTGTSGGATSLCGGVIPPSASILSTTYSITSSTGEINYGTSPYLWGTYTAQSPGVTKPVLTLAPTTGAITVSGAVAASDAGTSFVIMGFGFESGTECVNAASYAGVTFTIAGDLGGCDVRLMADDAEDSSSGTSPLARCTGSACRTASYAVTETGTFEVPFTAFTGGAPDAGFDPTSILSIQFQFDAP